MEPHSTTSPRPSSVPLLIVKAFTIAIALVVSTSLITNLVMDWIGYQ
jgi:hypothetical protein